MKTLINKMVERFLSWKLPDDFAPDCNINFNAEAAKQGSWPIGTNLLTSEQARKMFESMKDAIGKPVLWQYRHFENEKSCTPGWSNWEEVKPRNWYMDPTAEHMVAEIQAYIDAGYKYELRSLYAL